MSQPRETDKKLKGPLQKGSAFINVERKSERHNTSDNRNSQESPPKRLSTSLDKTFRNKLRGPGKSKPQNSNRPLSGLPKSDKRISTSQLLETRKDRIMKVVQEVNNSKKDLAKSKSKNEQNSSDKDKKTENSGSSALKESTPIKVSSTSTASTTSVSVATTVVNPLSVETSTNGKSNESTTQNNSTKTATSTTSTTSGNNDEIVKETNGNDIFIDLTSEKEDAKSKETVQNNEKDSEKNIEAEKQSENTPMDENISILSHYESTTEIITLDPEEPIAEEKKSESNSAPVVESTTSESSNENHNDNNDGKSSKDEPTNAQTKSDADKSFISYDSNIMLKDVKIKLNDCLKDNSKLFDVTDPSESINDSYKDLSFGRTLRNISGRNSLSRLRHVTIRDSKLSFNDSLFVNTSSASTMDRPEFDSPCLSSKIDRKRKLSETKESDEESQKRIKTDDNGSFFYSPLAYFKNLRKPIQVSSPNVQSYKFNLDEKMTNENNSTIESIDQPEPKKWCLIM